MRNVMNRKRHWLLLLLLSPFFLSCEDKMDEHYEKPEWLKGTAWEVLSNEYGGKFSMFLEAAELSGFKPILDGKSVATVMAPDNDAFAAYLEEHGYVSVKDIPTDDLKKLIGYHLIIARVILKTSARKTVQQAKTMMTMMNWEFYNRECITSFVHTAPVLLQRKWIHQQTIL